MYRAFFKGQRIPELFRNEYEARQEALEAFTADLQTTTEGRIRIRRQGGRAFSWAGEVESLTLIEEAIGEWITVTPDMLPPDQYDEEDSLLFCDVKTGKVHMGFFREDAFEDQHTGKTYSAFRIKKFFIIPDSSDHETD